MRKLIVPLVVASVALTGCVTPVKGIGEVTSKVIEPVEYYTQRDCTRKYSRAYCAVPRVKDEAEYEITVVNPEVEKEVEVEVPQFVYDNCEVGDFFDGDSCSTPLTPLPAAS